MTAVSFPLPRPAAAPPAAARRLDDLVVTAANAAQADGYRLQLQRRRRDGLLDAATRVHVVADAGGRRAGSGGATLAALAELARGGEPFAGRRAVVLHAGGDAKRLPAYAALGKLFAPLPCTTPDGQPAALFDLLLANLVRTPAPQSGHVLVASGDVLLTFDPDEVDFARPGVTGVAFPDSPERAARHGVYVADAAGRVADFLQKPGRAELDARGAADALGRCAVDTGLMSLAPDAADALLALADLIGGAGEIDLYEEVALALARRVTPDEYDRRVLTLPRNADADQRAKLERLYAAVRPLAFHVCVLPYCDFFHVGTTRELLAGLLGRSRTSSGYGFRNGARATLPADFPAGRAFAFNSVVETPPADWGEATVLEACHVRAALTLSRRNVVVGLPAEVTHAVALPDGVGLTVLPVGATEWAAVAFHIDDPGDFTAPRWPVGSADEAVAEALADGPGRLPRKSLADIVAAVDHGRLLEHRANLQRLGALGRPLDRLAAEPDLAAGPLADLVRTGEEAADLLEALAAGLPGCPKSVLPRALVLAQHVRQRAAHLPGAAHERIDAACRALADDGGTAALGRAALKAVGAALAVRLSPAAGRPRAAVEFDQVVWASAPARLDFAGGWSDTPPVCTDRGGCVVNAAIDLNGTAPLQAVAKLNDRYDIALTSIDRGERVVLTRVEELADHADPGRWDALPRAALVLAGLTGGATRGDLAEPLRDFGGGIDLTVFSALPQGSGLGAGSILGAAVLACLARLAGETLTPEQVVARASLLEQLRATGGGWQDAVGGVTPGVKLIQTPPGPAQTPSLSWLALDPAWRGQLLLYYTGLKRASKNILQGVVLRYLARDPKHVAVIEELKAGALAMRQAVETRDWPAFGRGLAQAWELKKRLDPGATTPAVERLAARAAPHCVGLGMPGAGGGGFLLLAARDGAAANAVRQELAAHPAAPGARFFDFAIDEQGLRVSVL